jgi:hypothetical protein
VFDHGIAESQADTPRPADFLPENGLGLADPGAEAHATFHAFFQVNDPLFLLGFLFILNVGNGAYRAIVGALLTSKAFFQINLHFLPLFFDVYTRSSNIHQS